MSRLPQVKPSEIEKILVKHGFVGRAAKSGHFVFTHSDGRRTVIPGHNRPICIGTLRAIIRQSGISVETFIAALRSN